MWRIMVVEDEKLLLELHTRLLEKHGPFQVLGSFPFPLDALKEIPEHELDALLLDIEMPAMTGIELAKQLVDIGIDVPVIFSTAYSQYAVEAFRVQALDYILKPMTPSIVKQLDERLTKYYGMQQRRTKAEKLYIQLYGDAYVKIGDRDVKWPTRVTEELFYYFLLQEGKLCSKWRIIDAIWPNLDEKRALSNLYNTIYRIRQLFVELEVPILINRVNGGYQMDAKENIVIENNENREEMLLESKGYLWAYSFDKK